ncbi:MAG: DUF4097 domain-containing protein [Humibacillus sp.]|nr:DUF4097 domain-containing protein [Humibacillus sp.]MDN5776793.1 DUF4097 domain-containing protein [Humibacillus sp.]
MSDDHDPAAQFGRRPQLPPRPPVPDDRIHGDSLDSTGERTWPGSAQPTGPGTEALGKPIRPSEPTSRRSRSPAGRRNRRRVVVLGVGALLLIGGLNVGWHVGSVEQHSTLTHAVTSIRVNGVAGDVEVSGGAPAGTVDLTRRLPRGSDPSPSAGETWEGSTLVIDANPGCGPLVFGCSVDYTLRVPNGTAVTVDDGSGDLKLGGSLGVVDVKTGSGDIKAKDLASATLAARSGCGDIDLGLAQAPNQLTLDTGSGDVDIEVPAADTYAVGVQTGSGDERVTVKEDANSPRKVQIKTGSGDVKFGYR